MGDIFNSIDQDKYAESSGTGGQGKEVSTVNTSKLRQQMKSLKKEVEKSPALRAPKNGRQAKRREMALNYDINVQGLAKWIGQVKRAREEVQSDFTTPDKLLHGGRVALNSIAQMAANVDDGQHLEQDADSMERQIQAELKKQGLTSEKDIKQKEMEALGSKLDSD